MALLNKRLTVEMPEGSVNEARGHNIMAAPESNQNETRLVYEEGDKKMVVMAWELFKKAGPDYDKEVIKAMDAWLDSEDTAIETKKIGEHIVVGTPETPNADSDAILYATALIRHDDETLQRVAFYFNPEFNKNPEECRKLAEKLVSSLKIGERKMNLKAGERRLAAMNEGSSLAVTVPAGWTFTTQKGPDFLVHQLREVSPFGESSSSLGFYLGGHPGYHHERMDEGELIESVRKSPLLGEEREWVEYLRKGQDDWRNVEVICALSEDGYWKAHVFGGAKDEKGLEEVLKIAATFKLESDEKAKESVGPK